MSIHSVQQVGLVANNSSLKSVSSQAKSPAIAQPGIQEPVAVERDILKEIESQKSPIKITEAGDSVSSKLNQIRDGKQPAADLGCNHWGWGDGGSCNHWGFGNALSVLLV